MKEQLPAPGFDPYQYERPNQKWICGRAAEGDACRIGPTPRGACRASFECSPTLELKPGEDRGRYRCTRPKEHGGPCEFGPRPDGMCSRAIPKCTPRPSLRAKRGRFTIACVALTLGVLLVLLGGPWRFDFVNPGEISVSHSGPAFLRMHGGSGTNSENCAACHAAALAGLSGWWQSAFSADPGPLEIQQLSASAPANMASIDRACQRCHAHHAVHQPNVVKNLSCSVCHPEHQGAGPIKAPVTANCTSCHGNARTMQLAADNGKLIAPMAFEHPFAQGLTLFKAPRPERGYTAVFHSFAGDHPEFRLSAGDWRETNTLRFNHQLHLSEKIPALNGKKLDCAYCHKPDPSGAFHQKITFEANCKTCHELRFDSRNPTLIVPHGNGIFVRAFLNSLPRQYADYGAQVKNIIGKRELEEFVQQELRFLREQVGFGENLEQQIFFNTQRTGPVADIGRAGDQGRARFPGCAYCHEVTGQKEGPPRITPPLIPDRWMLHAHFNHAKHTALSCTVCHAIQNSRETADISMPSKQACIACHSSKGGVADACMTCHQYHRREAIEQRSRR